MQCSDEQRFQVTAKLCEEVLGGVADGSLQLAASEGVLADALHILASKEIKLSAVQRYNKVLPVWVRGCVWLCMAVWVCSHTTRQSKATTRGASGRRLRYTCVLILYYCIVLYMCVFILRYKLSK